MTARAQRLGADRLVRPLLGLVVFQAAWFACVASAADGRPALGVAAVGIVVVAVLATSDRRGGDAGLLAMALVLGAVIDTSLARSGLVWYASPGPLADVAPVWILALWALFATVIRGPMRWLHSRPALAALLGAIGGPLSYAAAERLGACRLADGQRPVIALALVWAIATPALIALARRVDALPSRGVGAPR